VISATFSLTKQAVLLGIAPRLQIIQTSKDYQGQIYVPPINHVLFFGTFVLLMSFKTSANMAHAYGIAVNSTMLLITVMVAYAAYKVWQWSRFKVLLVFTVFILLDLAFLFANSHKFLTGGWVPVFFAVIIAYIMHTWGAGLAYLREHFYLDDVEIAKILHQLDYRSLNRLYGVTSIFITDIYDKSGGSFLHFLKLSMSVPEHVLIVNYTVENSPHVPDSKRYHLMRLNKTVCQLTLHYGFMDTISIPEALHVAVEKNILPFPVVVDAASYIVDVPNVIVSKQEKSPLSNIQVKVFSFLMRNFSANLNIEFYNLPHNRTIAIGSYCVI
jgi:KUP system potassium uptake protein